MGTETAVSTMRVGRKGRAVIPQEVREALGIHEGDTVVVRVEEGRAILETREAIRRELQAMFARIPADRVLSEELIAERRAEARREADEG